MDEQFTSDSLGLTPAFGWPQPLYDADSWAANKVTTDGSLGVPRSELKRHLAELESLVAASPHFGPVYAKRMADLRILLGQ